MLREQNGRFMKTSESSKCAGKPLAIKAMLSEPPAEANTLITNSVTLPALNIVAETRPNAFTSPLPSELVDVIFTHGILPHLKKSASSELQMQVCKNLCIKHYRSQLLNFLTSALTCKELSSCTYKNIQSVVCAAMLSLGF